MAIRHLAVAAALSLTAVVAAPAQAAISISVTPNNIPLPTGQQMVVDFDNANAAGFTFTQGPNSFVRSGALGLQSGVSAPPPGDITNYQTVTNGGSATLTSTGLMTSFSLFMGSPDSFNSIRFEGPGFFQTLTGPQLFDPATAFNGDQSIGRRITYDFGGATVNKITFLSTGNSFEFDDLAAGVAGVPEPTTWATMLLGVFGLGGALRTQRGRRTVAVTA